MEMNNYFPSPFTVWLVQGCVAIPTAIQSGGRTGLEVGRCRHPRPRRKILLSVPPSLPPSLSLEEKQFLFVRKHKGEERKGIVHQAQQSLGGFQQEDATAYEERKVHRRLIVKGQFNPSYTELPPAVPSLWGTCGTERLTDFFPCFAFHRQAQLPTNGESEAPRSSQGAICSVPLPQLCCQQPDPHQEHAAGTADLVGLPGPSLLAKNISQSKNVTLGKM